MYRENIKDKIIKKKKNSKKNIIGWVVRSHVAKLSTRAKGWALYKHPSVVRLMHSRNLESRSLKAHLVFPLSHRPLLCILAGPSMDPYKVCSLMRCCLLFLNANCFVFWCNFLIIVVNLWVNLWIFFFVFWSIGVVVRYLLFFRADCFCDW